MRDPVTFLLLVSLLAIVFPQGNQGYDQNLISSYGHLIKKDFDCLDGNNDTYIDKEEFRTKYPYSYVQKAFKKYDADEDGKLNYEEYRREALALD